MAVLSPTHGKQPHSGGFSSYPVPARHIDRQTPSTLECAQQITVCDRNSIINSIIHSLLNIHASIGVVMNLGGGLAQTRGQPCPVSDGSPMAPCPIRTRNRANHAHVEIEIGPQTLQGTPCSGRQFFSPSLTTGLITTCQLCTRLLHRHHCLSVIDAKKWLEMDAIRQVRMISTCLDECCTAQPTTAGSTRTARPRVFASLPASTRGLPTCIHFSSRASRA